jgi:type IV pilus assembly protein PilC
MLWQTLSYPVIIVVGFFAVLYFILVQLVPRWEPLLGGLSGTTFWVRAGGTYHTTDIAIPAVTRVLFAVSDLVSAIPGVIILAIAAMMLLLAWGFLHLAGRDGGLAERLILPLPLIGIVLRRNLVSRWCHAVALAVDAGMDLPGAIKLADDATASPKLQSDGASLIAALSAGQPLSAAHHPKVIPGTVIAAIEASSDRADLPLTLRALSQMYQQQAELRVNSIQAILTPIVLLFIGLFIGGLMFAMFQPLLTILNML